MQPEGSDPLNQTEPRPDKKTSLKQQGDGGNLNQDGQLTSYVWPRHLTSNQAPATARLRKRAPGNQELC